jgi:hypothetical protein
MATDMMFCPYCGSKAQSEKASVKANGPEHIEGIIPHAIARGGSHDGQMFTLILTKTRLLVAKVTDGDRIKIDKASLSVISGSMLLEPERARKAQGSYSRRYHSLDPEAILTESEMNFFVDLQRIMSVRISAEDDAEGNQFYLLSFRIAELSYEFLVPMERDTRDLIIATFEGKVRC